MTLEQQLATLLGRGWKLTEIVVRNAMGDDDRVGIAYDPDIDPVAIFDAIAEEVKYDPFANTILETPTMVARLFDGGVFVIAYPDQVTLDADDYGDYSDDAAI